MLLQLDQVTRHIGGRTLFAGVSMRVSAGDRIGLVGPNGAGKSTLLKIAAGDESADAGAVTRAKGARVGMLRQEIDPSLTHSVREEAAKALQHLDALESEMRRLEVEMSAVTAHDGEVSTSLADRYDRVSGAFEHGGGFERSSRVSMVLAGLGFDDAACDRPLDTFSGGWLMRVELAKLFLHPPDVLLLDEPTNHLDLPSIQWFEETLQAFRGGVVIVSHDRTFLRRHATRVAELDGVGRFAVYEGNYDRFLTQREERQSQLLAAKANQDREIAQMERFVERFRAKATKAKQAQSRVKALDRIERIEVGGAARKRIRLRIPKPPRSGQTVIKLERIEKSFGDKRVYSGIDFAAHRGDRIALVGPNGAGKSTLLRITAGALDFDAGERILGHNVQVAFYAQHQLDSLVAENSVLAELERAALTTDTPRLRGHLGAFLFSGDDVKKKVSILSGGEKARLALAKMLLHPSNLLVLDEPTNHLDIEACEVLEEALAQFAGTLVFVSHDRSFINALATRVVEVENGKLQGFSGNYDDYLRDVERTRPEFGRDAERDREVPVAHASANTAVAAKPARPSKEQRAQERERKKTRDRITRRIAKIETEIAEIEATLESLGWRLGDPEVFKDPDQVREVSAAREAAQSENDALYREWERLGDELAALEDAP